MMKKQFAMSKLKTVLACADLTYESFAYMEKTVREAQADSEYHSSGKFGARGVSHI